jgi:hypothetical protein
MAKGRKYDHYEVASNVQGEEETYYNYRSALSHYQHIKGYGRGTRATLWGIDEMGEYTCIQSFNYK